MSQNYKRKTPVVKVKNHEFGRETRERDAKRKCLRRQKSNHIPFLNKVNKSIGFAFLSRVSRVIFQLPRRAGRYPSSGLTRAVPAALLRLRFVPSPRNGARGHFATDVASGVATQRNQPLMNANKENEFAFFYPCRYSRAFVVSFLVFLSGS